MDDRTLFALVARKVPTIWNAVGPASLNPQPLPPEPPPDVFGELNPQPLPPGPPPELYGAAVGRELLRIAHQAELLGYDAASAWARDAVATPAGAPVIPPWLPQVHQPNDAWREGYFLGLACALACAPATATTTSAESAVDSLFAQAVAALDAATRPAAPAPTAE
jgi:hypothetical protein